VKSASFLALAAALLLAVPLPAPAAPRPAGVTEKLREQLKPLAKAIHDILQQEEQTTVAVGAFIGPAGFETNYGPGIQLLLAQELEALQRGVVVPKSNLSVKGSYEYEDVDDPQSADKLRVIKLYAEVRKRNGKVVTQLAKELRDKPLVIKDSEVIAAMIAPGPIRLDPRSGRKDLNDHIRRMADKPAFTPSGSRIRCGPHSPFGVELLIVSAEDAPADEAGWAKVPARAPAGDTTERLPQVDIRRGEVYAVRLFNDTRHDAAVTLTIDGIDEFTFSRERKPAGSKFPAGRPKYTHFIIPAGRASVITGWHRTNRKADSFLVTGYGKGAVSLVPGASRGKVGVLTVTFALAWQGKDVPEEEKGSRSAGGNETGFGPPTKVRQREVKRHIGVVREVVSVRYTR
jgi:hypothetical protein